MWKKWVMSAAVLAAATLALGVPASALTTTTYMDYEVATAPKTSDPTGNILSSWGFADFFNQDDPSNNWGTCPDCILFEQGPGYVTSTFGEGAILGTNGGNYPPVGQPMDFTIAINDVNYTPGDYFKMMYWDDIPYTQLANVRVNITHAGWQTLNMEIGSMPGDLDYPGLAIYSYDQNAGIEITNVGLSPEYPQGGDGGDGNGGVIGDGGGETPETSTWAMIVIGLAGLGLVKRFGKNGELAGRQGLCAE